MVTRDFIKEVRGELGFTLLELLLVLFILILIIGIVASNLTGISGGARSKAAGEELRVVQKAFDTMMTEVRAITISECLIPGGESVGPSTAITGYRRDGTHIVLPGHYYLRLRTNSTGRYTWGSEGFVNQTSY